MTPNQSFFAAAIFVSFFVLWFFGAAVGDRFICWIGGKNNLSGWVQAIGSILAIFASALVTRNFFVQAEINNEKKAAKLLILIFQEVHLFYFNWSKVNDELIKGGIVNAGSVNSFKRIALENLSCVGDIQIENLSLTWASIAIRCRSSFAYLAQELENFVEVHDKYTRKLNPDIEDSERDRLFELRKRKLLIISNTIIDIQRGFEEMQISLVNTSLEKCIYSAPGNLIDALSFSDFPHIEKAKI